MRAAIEVDAAYLHLELGQHHEPRLVLHDLDGIGHRRQHHARHARPVAPGARLGDRAELRRECVEQRLSLGGIAHRVAATVGILDGERHPDTRQVGACDGASEPGPTPARACSPATVQAKLHTQQRDATRWPYEVSGEEPAAPIVAAARGETHARYRLYSVRPIFRYSRSTTMTRRTSTIFAAAAVFAASAPAALLAQPPAAESVELSEARRTPAEQQAAAYKDKNWTAPRTSWGHPNLQGTWSTDDMRGIPRERPEALGTQESLVAGAVRRARHHAADRSHARRDHRDVPS